METKLHTIKVCFSDGDYIVTDINASERRIREYYKIGSTFNTGVYDDHLVKVVSVEILNR
jgi:hypothetical protein